MLSAAQTWPTYMPTAEAKAAAQQALADFSVHPKRIVDAQPYSTDGDYLDYGKKSPWVQSKLPIPLGQNGIVFDADGMPLIKRRHLEGLYFNPVSHAQFALATYGRIATGQASEAFFLKAADRFIEQQSDDGSYRYEFPFRHYSMDKPYAHGWISGMAQGQALSVLARAYLLTHDEKYKEAGDKALAFLLTRQEDGGPATDLTDLDPSLSGYIFFEEYVTEPDVYTLNGFIFIMLGLYDWQTATGSGQAADAFSQGIRSLVKMLPLYEVAGFSAYDLSYLTVKRPDYEGVGIPHLSTGYHALHIQLLQTLASITDEPIFAETAARWRSFVAKKPG